jgi:methylmalonyl-CoA/ethylmalonyl-CoA epimerase
MPNRVLSAYTVSMEIHHTGIAVEDLEQAAQPYLVLGYQVENRGLVASQGVEVWMLVSGRSRIELLYPTQLDSPVGKFLARRGPGLHHLALSTGHLEQSLADLASHGARLIDTTPRPGFGGHRVAFVHPSWSGGVLIELVEDDG